MTTCQHLPNLRGYSLLSNVCALVLSNIQAAVKINDESIVDR